MRPERDTQRPRGLGLWNESGVLCNNTALNEEVLHTKSSINHKILSQVSCPIWRISSVTGLARRGCITPQQQQQQHHLHHHVWRHKSQSVTTLGNRLFLSINTLGGDRCMIRWSDRDNDHIAGHYKTFILCRALCGTAVQQRRGEGAKWSSIHPSNAI